MTVKAAKYTKSGQIAAVIGGVEFVIPDVAGNRHRQAVADWEAQGGVIDAYSPSGPQPRRMGSAREFLHLFTEQERLAFFAAKQSSAALELWWAEASTGQFSLDHPSVAQGLAQLVAAGLLAEGRKAEIMAADFDAVV